MAKITSYKGINYILAQDKTEYYKCLADYEDGQPADDSSFKLRCERAKIHGMEAMFYYHDTLLHTVVVNMAEGTPNTRTLRQQVIDLCEKYDIEYERIRYYKQSPYQKARYRAEYVGEEVWIKVQGFSHCINSVNDADPFGSVEDYIKALFV